MFYFRLRPEFAQRSLQIQLTLSASSTFGYNRSTANDEADPARQFKLSRSYVSLGVAFYPHLLWQNK